MSGDEVVQRPRSHDLRPGTRLRWRGQSEAVLSHRKDPDDRRAISVPFHPGWWLADSRGGLADFVIDDPNGGWEILPHSDGYRTTGPSTGDRQT